MEVEYDAGRLGRAGVDLGDDRVDEQVLDVLVAGPVDDLVDLHVQHLHDLLPAALSPLGVHCLRYL